MNKLILTAALIVTFLTMLSSCRCITVTDAANGKAKCGKRLK